MGNYSTDYVRGKHKIYQGEFTIILKIIPERKDELKKFILSVDAQQAGEFNIDFESMKSMHYCRWFVIDEARDADDHLLPPMLCFSTVYDGSLDHHLQEWFLLAERTLDEIYRCCIGYALSSSSAEKISWLKKYRHKEKLFWAAKGGGTHEMILKENELHAAIEKWLTDEYKREELSLLGSRILFDRIKDFVNNSSDLNWAMKPEPSPSLLAILRNMVWLIGFVVFMLCLIPLLVIWIPLMFYFEGRDNRHPATAQPKNLSSVLNLEDKYFQNQLTIYGTLKKPGWFKINNLRLYLAFARKLMRYRATHGDLSGITTIHFVSYVMFEGGKNAMFLSNYDGGWESYLNEFIDQAASVMNLSFGNFKGYPPMHKIIKDGAHDEQTFKTIVRQYQYPCQLWYSAYPAITISNILNNSAIRKGLSKNLTDAEVSEWLRRF